MVLPHQGEGAWGLSETLLRTSAGILADVGQNRTRRSWHKQIRRVRQLEIDGKASPTLGTTVNVYSAVELRGLFETFLTVAPAVQVLDDLCERRLPLTKRILAKKLVNRVTALLDKFRPLQTFQSDEREA